MDAIKKAGFVETMEKNVAVLRERKTGRILAKVALYLDKAPEVKEACQNRVVNEWTTRFIQAWESSQK